jgi:hypothetical protein
MVVGPVPTAAAYPGVVPIDVVGYSIVELGVPTGTTQSNVYSIDSAGDVAGSVAAQERTPARVRVAQWHAARHGRIPIGDEVIE